MPRKPRSYECACGCGGATKGGQWLPGHDAKLISAIIEAVGGHQSLRNLAENHIGHPIEVEIQAMKAAQPSVVVNVGIPSAYEFFFDPALPG